MAEIITVRFKRGGKQYFFDPKGESIKPGEGVIVDTSRGNEFGECVLGNHEKEDNKIIAPLRELVRRATEKDYAVVEKNQAREKWARKVCIEKIAHHKLDMKIVGVELSFEGNKVLFFFTSDGRVDFRGLVKDLAATIHARIELRQIGVRDEARMVGGLGICGRPFCCNQFLDRFAPVSIKMAKTQSLSLNPAKISGTCGRLMCCLKFEQDAYEHLIKTAPRSESFVETPDGAGTIAAVNLLRQQATVRLEADPSVAKKYHNSEIVVVRSGRGKRPEGYVQPPLKQLEKQRRVTEGTQQQTSGENSLADALEAMFSQLDTEPPKKSPQKREGKGQDQRRGNSPKGRKQGKEGQKPSGKPTGKENVNVQAKKEQRDLKEQGKPIQKKIKPNRNPNQPQNNKRPNETVTENAATPPKASKNNNRSNNPATPNRSKPRRQGNKPPFAKKSGDAKTVKEEKTGKNIENKERTKEKPTKNKENENE